MAENVDTVTREMDTEGVADTLEALAETTAVVFVDRPEMYTEDDTLLKGPVLDVALKITLVDVLDDAEAIDAVRETKV